MLIQIYMQGLPPPSTLLSPLFKKGIVLAGTLSCNLLFWTYLSQLGQYTHMQVIFNNHVSAHCMNNSLLMGTGKVSSSQRLQRILTLEDIRSVRLMLNSKTAKSKWHVHFNPKLLI